MQWFKRIWLALGHLSLAHWLWTLGSSTVGSAVIAGVVSVVTDWPLWIYIALFAGLVLLIGALLVDRIFLPTTEVDDVMAVPGSRESRQENPPASRPKVEPSSSPVLEEPATIIKEGVREPNSATPTRASAPNSVKAGSSSRLRQSLQEELRHGVMLRQRAHGSSMQAMASGISATTEEEVEQWETRVTDLLEDENRPLLVAVFLADPPKRLGTIAMAAYWNPLGDRLGHRLQALDSIVRSL